MVGKAPPDVQAERVRDVLRRLLDERFDGNATKFARALGVAQPTLSFILSGKSGPGMKTLDGLVRLTGATIDQLLQGEVPGELPDAALAPNFGAIPGWKDAEAHARKDHPDVPLWAFEKARRVSGLLPPSPLTVDFVYELALFTYRHASDDERQRREKEQLDRAIKRLRTRASNEIAKKATPRSAKTPRC